MQGYEFATGKFQDVTWLMGEVTTLYDRIVERYGPAKALLPVTAEQIVKAREWEPSMPLIAAALPAVLEELKVFYIPKMLQPGPGIVFAQRDIMGNYTRARMKPFYDLILKDGKAKYGALGVKASESRGPNWFGSSIENTVRLLRHRKVVLVEGPFDHLACRLVCPDLPIMSTGTKAFGPEHLDYLDMMGVRHIAFMWDNEEGSKKGIAAMEMASHVLAKDGRFGSSILLCPRQDPSECLKNYDHTSALRRQLFSTFA